MRFLLLLGFRLLARRGGESGTVTLTWSAHDPDDASLQVWYWVGVLPPEGVWIEQKTQATTASFSGLAAGADHQYTIDVYSCTATEAAGYVADAARPDCAIAAPLDSGIVTSTGSRDAGDDPPDPVFSGSINVSWPPVLDQEGGAVWYVVVANGGDVTTDKTSATVTDLAIGTEYNWHVDAHSCLEGETMPDCPLIAGEFASGTAIAMADRQGSPAEGSGGNRSGLRSGAGDDDEDDEEDSDSGPQPPVYVDHSVTVSGDARYQALTYDGIGDSDIIALGVISATNVWGTVPPGTRVCFVGKRGGGVMFKDSSSTPHPLYWLGHFLVGNDTCVDLPGAGTVVLVKQAGPYGAAGPELAPAVAEICQIKLTETLFLRAEPDGDIIGLVWLNSEAPVYAVDGDWYLIEFEGRAGYISRYHRRILDGNCG